MKRCKKCGETKELVDFYGDRAARDGHRPECKACTSASRKVYYAEHREEIIDRVKRWQRENRDKYAAKQRAWRASNPGSHRPRHLEKNFGLTTTEFDEMTAAQGGRCAICGRAPTAGKHLHVDHDHETNEVRGLLCFSCNVGVGNFGNDVERLQRAVDYLEQRPAERTTFEGLARERAGLLTGVA